MLSRFPNWPTLLEFFLRENHQRKFIYGQFDCCLFVADAVQIMTGTDLADTLRGYSSRAGALQAVTALTGKPSIQSAAETLAERHGMPEVPVLRASRGDMALIPRAHGRDYSMGLVSLSGRTLWIAVRNGIGEIPLERASRAWRV